MKNYCEIVRKRLVWLYWLKIIKSWSEIQLFNDLSSDIYQKFGLWVSLNLNWFTVFKYFKKGLWMQIKEK